MKLTTYKWNLCVFIALLSIVLMSSSCSKEHEREYTPQLPIEGVWQTINDSSDKIIRMEFTNNGISKFYSFENDKLQEFCRGTWNKTGNDYTFTLENQILACRIVNNKLELVGLAEQSGILELERSTKEIHQPPLVPNSIDLGLSILWNMYNQGTVNPDGRGDYFTYDDLQNIDYDDGWRLPTRAEFKELCEECYWTWSIHDGVPGYEVTGLNGNTIFLPASGWKEGGLYRNIGTHGYYWSGTTDTTDGGLYISRLEFHYSGICNTNSVTKVNLLTGKLHEFTIRLVHK